MTTSLRQYTPADADRVVELSLAAWAPVFASFREMPATGGDPGHAPARATYEKAGFTGSPQVWYAKRL